MAVSNSVELEIDDTKLAEIMFQAASKELIETLKPKEEEFKREIQGHIPYELKTSQINIEKVFGTLQMEVRNLGFELKIQLICVKLKFLNTQAIKAFTGGCFKKLEGHTGWVYSVHFDCKGLLAS